MSDVTPQMRALQARQAEWTRDHPSHVEIVAQARAESAARKAAALKVYAAGDARRGRRG